MKPDGATILVAGAGNLFQGDDAFGSTVVRQLATESLPEGVLARDYGTGGVHLAYDLLEDWEALVLVDVVDRGTAPGDVVVIEVDPASYAESTGELHTHAMDPHSVFATLATLGGTLPAWTRVVGCQPKDVSHRMGLSDVVEDAVAPTIIVVRELLDDLSRRIGQSTTGHDRDQEAMIR